MKYRIKEVLDKEGRHFYPQCRKFFIWRELFDPEKFDVTPNTIHPRVAEFETFDDAVTFLENYDRDLQFAPSIKIHDIEIPQKYAYKS